MGEIHPDTPRMDDQTEHTQNRTLPTLLPHAYTNGTTRNHGHNVHDPALALRKRYNFRTQLDGKHYQKDVSSPTGPASNRVTRYGKTPEKQDDVGSHRSSLNCGMQLGTNVITAANYYTIQKNTLPESRQSTQNYKSDGRRKQARKYYQMKTADHSQGHRDFGYQTIWLHRISVEQLEANRQSSTLKTREVSLDQLQCLFWNFQDDPMEVIQR